MANSFPDNSGSATSYDDDSEQLKPFRIQLAERINQLRFGTLRHWLAQLDEAALTAFYQGSQALAEVAKQDTGRNA